MKKLILFVVLFFAVTTLVNADGITRRVKFQKGQFAATFEGGVILFFVNGKRQNSLAWISHIDLMIIIAKLNNVLQTFSIPLTA